MTISTQYFRACSARARAIYRSAAAQAHLILKRRFRYEHGISSPIETRGVVAQWNARADQITIWDTTQARCSSAMGLPASSVSENGRCA